jgi:hypothetical protein
LGLAAGDGGRKEKIVAQIIKKIKEPVLFKFLVTTVSSTIVLREKSRFPTIDIDDLNNLINDYPDDISTEEALQPILMTVSQWCYDAKSTSYGTNPPKANTTTTATTIITKANTPPHETTTITTPTTFQHETTTTALATISPTTVTTTATNHNPND